MPLDANGNVVITKVPSVQMPKLPANWNPKPGYGGIVIRSAGAKPSGITVNNKPTPTNYTAPDGRDVHLPGYNPPPAPAPEPEPEPSNRDRDSYAHPMSAEFIQDTYDPLLGYENYNSPGDNPYISNFTPKQFGYMNDLSTLSPEELAYRKGNEKGLIDREGTAEQAGALLKNWIFRINDELKNQDELELKVGTIGKESDDESDEQYRRRYKESPYDEYDPSKYY